MRETNALNTAAADLLRVASFSGYLEIGRRRKWWIILTTLSLFVVATVIARRLPDIYRAETVILVDPQQVPDKYVPATMAANIADRLTTLQQQVLSPTRLMRLVESEHLYPDPSGKKSVQDVIKAVQASITVEVVNPGGAKMGAFKITYSGRRRDEVARMANQIAVMFIEENLNARVEQAEGTKDFLQSQLEETKRQLDVKENQLRAIKTHNILDLPESKPYHLEALATLRNEYQTIQGKIAQDQREKSLLQSMLVSGAQAPTVDLDTEGGNAANPYQAEIQKLESTLSDLRGRYGPSHPDVRKAQGELDRLRKKAQSDAQNAPAPVAQIDPQAAAQKAARRRNPVVEAQIENLDEDMQAQSKLLPPIQVKIDFHTSKLEAIPGFEQQLGGLQRDYDILKTQYTAVLDKKLAAEMSSALEVHQKGERFVVLDAAATPEGPYAPNRILISLGGLIGGLMAGIVLAAFAEFTNEFVRSEGEAAQILGKPVLAGVPHILSLADRRSRRLRAVGLVSATLVGSAAFGLALSILALRFF